MNYYRWEKNRFVLIYTEQKKMETEQNNRGEANQVRPLDA
jgi:hypothetical protein